MNMNKILLLVFFFLVCSGMAFSQVKATSNTTVVELKNSNLKEDSIQNATKNLKGFPVAPFTETLFYIYNKIGSFTAKDRAEAISKRIVQLYDDPFFVPDSLRISKSDISYDIIYKSEFVIMSISDLDAKAVGKDGQALARENLAIIKKVILFQQENNSDVSWLKRIGLVLLLISLIGLILYVINKLFRWLKFFLIKNSEKHFKGFKLKESYVFAPDKQLSLVLKLLGIIRIAVLILAFYLSLPVLFSIFPATKGYASILLNWIFSPAKLALMGFVHFLPNLFSILVIVFLFRYTIKALKFFVDEIQKGAINIDGFYSDWAKPTFNIVKILMYAFMVVIIFPYLPGSNSPIFKGVSVFIGILFSLGSSNAIANMVAGLVITYMRPFKIGDFIKIGDVSGEVIEKTALVTRIRTPKFEDITIPNATVLSSASTNYSANTESSANGLLVHTTVTIGYDAPWKTVQQALLNAASRIDLLEKIPAPFVLQTSLDDFYVSYEINAYTKASTKQPLIYSMLHQNIQDCFNEDGIEIMSPHYKALRDGNRTTIPEDFLDKEYQTPGFKIKKEE